MLLLLDTEKHNDEHFTPSLFSTNSQLALASLDLIRKHLKSLDQACESGLGMGANSTLCTMRNHDV